MNIWLMIVLVAVVTALIKGAGPLLLGGRELPPRAAGVIALMPGVLLAALVVTSTLADGRRLGVDAATAGVAVAGVLLLMRAHVLVAVVAAAVVTALLRAVV